METIMHDDELKSAWQDLSRRIERQDTINLQLLRERKLDKVRSNMRRMYWGKIAQILFGDALIFSGITACVRHHAEPHLLVCSIFMLAYGVLAVVLGGVTLGKISRIDYAAPALAMQKRVVAMQRLYRLFNLWLGMPWWFLWIAIFALETKANAGVDLFASAPAFIWINLAFGAVGCIATIWYFRRHKARGDDAIHAAPRGLRDAQARLEELRAFERE